MTRFDRSLVKSYRSGWTISAITKDTGATRRHILWALDEAGEPVRAASPQLFVPDRRKLKRAQKAREKGASWREVGRILSCSHPTARRILLERAS